MELHNGRIYAESDGLGCGCVFTVELPLRYSSIAQEKNDLNRSSLRERLVPSNKTLPYLDRRVSSVSPIDTEGDEDIVGASLNVHRAVSGNISSSACVPRKSTQCSFRALVVDDAPLNRKMLSRVLMDCCGDQCCSVSEASDGLVALDMVQRSMSGVHTASRIDVILIDFVMPNMNGPAAVKEIRALGYNGFVIGVTGNALAEDVECFMRNGADKVLIKPVNARLLGSLIEGRQRTI